MLRIVRFLQVQLDYGAASVSTKRIGRTCALFVKYGLPLCFVTASHRVRGLGFRVQGSELNPEL